MAMQNKVGLVLGKFLPMHKGHEYLIEWAKKRCDLLYVLSCTQKDEPMQNRPELIKEVFMYEKDIVVVAFDNDLPNTSESSRDISLIWSKVLKEKFPDVTTIFGSEKYIEYVAEYMGIDFMMCDEPRSNVPISATEIKSYLYRYWDYLSEPFKRELVKKICIIGPESCGKSTLTENLAKHFGSAFVPELARQMIDDSYITMDTLNIYHLRGFAKAQTAMVESMLAFARRYLFCDTDNITTQVFAKEFYGLDDYEISKYDSIKYDLYLLMSVDVPWIDDGQRNLSHKRQELFSEFASRLDSANLPYVVIDGDDWQERTDKAIEVIEDRFKNAKWFD